MKDYVETGKIKYVFLDFPLESIHRQAFKAHEAANCAGDQGKYWEMHDRLFTNQRALGPKELSGHAGSIGLNMSVFEECLNSGKHASEIRKDLETGSKAGIRGTPSFLVGLTQAGGSKVNATQMIRGAQPYVSFKQAIDSLLEPQKK